MKFRQTRFKSIATQRKRQPATASLIITGNKAYIKHMSSHLYKEHPSTRRRMHIKY